MFFFILGLVDRSVSSFNLGIWLVALAVVGIVPASGFRLATRGHHLAAIFVLGISALPGILYALFILLVIVSDTSWN